MKKIVRVIHFNGEDEFVEMDIPDPEPPAPPEPTRMDVLESQVTYTALKTNTLIPAPKKGAKA